MRSVIDGSGIQLGAQSLHWEPKGAFTGEISASMLVEAGCTYVALDCDVVEPDELSVFMPEPDGLSVAEIQRLFGDLARRTNVVGAGLTGLSFERSNVEPLARLTHALGL